MSDNQAVSTMTNLALATIASYAIRPMNPVLADAVLTGAVAAEAAGAAAVAQIGRCAARVGDEHACGAGGGPIVAPGIPTVLIGDQPAAMPGAVCTCLTLSVGLPDAIYSGSMTVLIGDLPAVRIGDQTWAGGAIITGLPTVFIG